MVNALPVSHFIVLTFGDVYQNFGGRMFDIEEIEDGGSVVGDSGVF